MENYEFKKNLKFSNYFFKNRFVPFFVMQFYTLLSFWLVVQNNPTQKYCRTEIFSARLLIARYQPAGQARGPSPGSRSESPARPGLKISARAHA